MVAPNKYGTCRFNSRAHGGRDHRREALPRRPRLFQFTRPRGARRSSAPRTTTTKEFQFTRPRGARHAVADDLARARAFQFTRPRGARPQSRSTSWRGPSVSIHAPTGGATLDGHAIRGQHPFQFTRPRGARPKRGVSPRSESSFNSRAHGGRDPYSTKGRPRRPGFNSRAHGGRDRKRTTVSTRIEFQFTRPRGARPGNPSASFQR